MTGGGPLLRGAIGAVVSLAVHGAGALAVMALVAPEPVPDQPLPRSRIDLETVALNRSDAREQPADGAEAEGVTPDARLAPGQGVPRRDAVAVATPAGRTASEAPQGPAVAALPPSGNSRPAVEAPDAAALALSPPGVTAPGTSPTGRPAADLSAPSVALTAGVPSVPSVAAAAPRSEAVPARPADSALAGSVAPAARMTTALAPPSRDALGLQDAAPRLGTVPATGHRAEGAAARGRAATRVAAEAGTVREPVPDGAELRPVDVGGPAAGQVAPAPRLANTAPREDRPAAPIAASGATAPATDMPAERAEAAAPDAPPAPGVAARGRLAPSPEPDAPPSRPAPMITQVVAPRDPARPVAVAFRPESQPVSAAPAPDTAAAQRQPEWSVAAAAPPEASSIDPADAAMAGTAAPTRPPPERTAATAAPDAPPALPSPDTGPTLSAALEWSGTGALDPASLGALSAFLPAERRGAAGEAARDGIAAIMASVPCARLRVEFDAATGALELHGHVPDDAARAPIAAALQAQIGESLPVRDALRLLPEPQCGVLSGMAATGLPQSEEEFTDPEIVGESAWARDFAFEDGARLVIDLEAPDYPAYLYVDYYDANGDVLHLTPNTESPLRREQPGAPVSVGRDDGLELRIAPPFGQDIVVALAVDKPLYDGLRPLVEPADAYLAFLRQRLETLGEYRGEWVYLFVETMPRRQ